jgi:hypothetical protein
MIGKSRKAWWAIVHLLQANTRGRHRQGALKKGEKANNRSRQWKLPVRAGVQARRATLPLYKVVRLKRR